MPSSPQRPPRWKAPRAGLWVLAAGALACALFATFSLRRYRQIARLASEVDEVLHGDRRIAFSDYREGDLAVLRNELAKMVAALRTATERLDAEKNALADALADVSHQIRTPLTAMGLLIGTAERTSDEAERIRALHELETLVSRVGWLVTALLKLAKADAGAIRVQARPVDAARLVRDALAPLAGAFDLRDVACETHVDEGASFNGDAAWSAEALGNILKNCMEHTPAGGCVRVQASEDAVAFRLSVADTWASPPRAASPPVRALLLRRGIGGVRHRPRAGPGARDRPGRHAARGQRPRNGRRSLRPDVPEGGRVGGPSPGTAGWPNMTIPSCGVHARASAGWHTIP